MAALFEIIQLRSFQLNFVRAQHLLENQSKDFISKEDALTIKDLTTLKQAAEEFIFAKNQLIDCMRKKQMFVADIPTLESSADKMLAKTYALLMMTLNYDIRVFHTHQNPMRDRGMDKLIAFHAAIRADVSIDVLQSKLPSYKQLLKDWTEKYSDQPGKAKAVNELTDFLLAAFLPKARALQAKL